MNKITDLYNLLHGLPPVPKCDDFNKTFGAVEVKDYSCPKCGKMEDEHDDYTYMINNEMYPKCFNEFRGSTIDGNYRYWDELHCCTNCNTMYWFSNSES